jgi:hypothetical protein
MNFTMVEEFTICGPVSAAWSHLCVLLLTDLSNLAIALPDSGHAKREHLFVYVQCRHLLE